MIIHKKIEFMIVYIKEPFCDSPVDHWKLYPITEEKKTNTEKMFKKNLQNDL